MSSKPSKNEKASTLVMVLVVLAILLSVGTTMLLVAGPETLSLHPGTAGGNGGETGQVIPVVVYKVYAQAIDGTISMQPGNVLPTIGDIWQLQLTQGQLKTGFSASDLIIGTMPDGLTASLDSFDVNTGTIAISVTGTAVNPVDPSQTVDIIIKGSALTMQGATDSDPIAVQLVSANVDIAGDAVDSAIYMLGPQHISVDPADNIWRIHLTKGTVREGIVVGDIQVNFPPEASGLTVTDAVYQPGNIIEITVGGSAAAAIHTAINNISILVQASAVNEPGANAGTITGFSILPREWQIQGTVTDSIVKTASDQVNIVAADNTWTIDVTQGTVKGNVGDALNAGDLTISGLHAGLNWTAVKGIGNSIIITVSGPAASSINTTESIGIVINPSAVVEGAALASPSLNAQVVPGFIIAGAASADNTITMQGPGCTTVAAGDNTWTLNVTNATVKAGVSASDITINNLPAGLTYTAAKGTGNSIIVTVGGTATVPVTTVISNISMIVLPSAVSETGAIQSNPISGFSVQVGTFQITGNATDDKVMTAGNGKSIGADNTWTINVTNGTVKPTLTVADLTITGLPAGLNCTAAKGTGNTIVITVNGTANQSLTGLVNVGIVIKSTAVMEANALNSASITSYIDPTLDPITIDVYSSDPITEPCVGKYYLKLTAASPSAEIFFTTTTGITGGDPRHGNKYVAYAANTTIGPVSSEVYITVSAIGRIGGQFRNESEWSRTFWFLPYPDTPTTSQHSNYYYNGSSWAEDPTYSWFPYASVQSITANSTVGSRVYYTYTNDGSTPADPAASSIYVLANQAVTIDTDTWIRVVACKNNVYSYYGGDVAYGYRTWKPGISYARNVNVWYNGIVYRCTTAHTSQAGSPPGVSPYWTTTNLSATIGFAYGFEAGGCY